ncbi:hypothetical protein TcCL_NonESM12807, partial [Trypanosoma cruzi]
VFLRDAETPFLREAPTSWRGPPDGVNTQPHQRHRLMAVSEVSPLARPQHARMPVVHVGNESNPAGHDDSGVTKNCGTIRDESGAPLDKERDRGMYLQPGRLEAVCCFSTCVDNGESLV